MGADGWRKFLRWIHAGDLALDPSEKKSAAERDIRRLKWNWVFVCFIALMGAINYSCPLPTNHQFVINPTAKSMNNLTNEKIEPGLQESESLYSLTYTVFFLGYTAAAIANGLLFNLIPTWYLFVVAILTHTLGYLFYALSINGWMMMVARGLAGLSLGLSISVTFAYFGVSSDKYAENLKFLGKFEEKKVARVKGFIFSIFNIGYTTGFAFGGGFPIVLAQFPDSPQFRPPGWYCVAVGVALLLLLLVLFRGECEWHHRHAHTAKGNDGLWKVLQSFVKRKDVKRTERICIVFIPLYIILVGGVKGARYVLPELLLNPIVSDSFGFSEKEISYIFVVFFGGSVFGVVTLYTLQYFKFTGYMLTVLGLTCTITGLLVMTDWQAIPHDSCTDHSLFHHPELAHLYRTLLTPPNDTVADVERYRYDLCIPQPSNSKIEVVAVYQSLYYSWQGMDTAMKHELLLNCTPVDSCPKWRYSHTAMYLITRVNYTASSSGICLNYIHNDELPTSDSEPPHYAAGDAILCTSGLGSSSCFILDPECQNGNQTLSLADQSLLAEAHVQSLQVVEKAVYEKAVSECVSAGEHCHWIPDSRITHKHCSDCQPICRSTQHTLNFVQFTIGMAFFISTLHLMFTGIFLLLSNSVSKPFQGVSTGSMTALMGIVRSTAPIWLDITYEKAKKRTYLPMLTLVALFLPLLCGLLLLYPWLGGRHKTKELQPQDKKEDDEKTELIPATELKSSRDSDE